MREMIEKNAAFRSCLQSMFQEQYLPFEQSIRFLRNVLTHTATASLFIQQADYEKQKEFLLSKSVEKIHLDFRYSDHLPERKGSKEYRCQVSIDFSKLHPATSLRKIVSLHQMYLLSELCYNVSRVISARIKRSTLGKEKPKIIKPLKKINKKI
jgi:hypothetical protein